MDDVMLRKLLAKKAENELMDEIQFPKKVEKCETHKDEKCFGHWLKEIWKN